MAAVFVCLGVPTRTSAQQARLATPDSGGEYVFRVTRRAMNGSRLRPLPASEIVVRSASGRLRFDAGRPGVSTGALPADLSVGRDTAGAPWWLADQASRTITSLEFGALMRLASDDAESELDVVQQEAEVLGAGAPVQGRPTLRVRIRRAVSVRSIASAERPTVRIHSVTEAIIDTGAAEPPSLAEGLALLSGSFVDLVFAAGVGNVELRDGGRVPRGLVVFAESYTEEQVLAISADGDDATTAVSWIDTVRMTAVRPVAAFGPKAFTPPAAYKRVPLAVAVRGPSRWVPDLLRRVPSRLPARKRER